MIKTASGARAVIIDAFNRLVVTRRRLKPRVAEVLHEAGVARSTFYEHFDSRDSLLMTALEGPLSIIADAAAGECNDQRLVQILDHLREHRKGAVELLTGPLAARAVRTLGGLIAERLGDGADGGALHLADQQLGFIRLWLTGETPASSNAIAAVMTASAAAQRSVLFTAGARRP